MLVAERERAEAAGPTAGRRNATAMARCYKKADISLLRDLLRNTRIGQLGYAHDGFCRLITIPKQRNWRNAVVDEPRRLIFVDRTKSVIKNIYRLDPLCPSIQLTKRSPFQGKAARGLQWTACNRIPFFLAKRIKYRELKISLRKLVKPKTSCPYPDELKNLIAESLVRVLNWRVLQICIQPTIFFLL